MVLLSAAWMSHTRFLFRNNLSGHWLANRSTTTSLGSSIYDSVEENGRTYHRFKEGSEFSRPSWDRADSLIELECVLPNNQVSQKKTHICVLPAGWNFKWVQILRGCVYWLCKAGLCAWGIGQASPMFAFVIMIMYANMKLLKVEEI